MAENKKSSIVTKSTCHLLNIKQPDRVAKRLKLSFQRTQAAITILKSDKSTPASMSLLDLSEAGAGFFTEVLLLKGSAVEVCITEPRLLKVKGIVAWSVPVTSGIHQGKFKFRSGVQFIFDNEMQRTAVLEFITKVNIDPIADYKAQNIPAPMPATGLAEELAVPQAPPTALGDPAATPVAPAAEGAPVGAPAEAAPVEAGAAPASEPAATATPDAVAATPTPATGEGESGGQSQAA